jgi:hypothetical protein
MTKNKFKNWIEEESVIFANIPIKWHITLLFFGLTLGIMIATIVNFIR